MLENGSQLIYYKRRLPHLIQQDHAVFITWRLNHDLPISIRDQLSIMKKNFVQSILNDSDDHKQIKTYIFQKKQFDWLDTQLALAIDFPKTLMQKEIAEIIMESLHFNDTKKYQLHSYCIMPNHVHVLVTPFTEKKEWNKILSSITQSWKGFTARKINLILNRNGAFWSRESYDHMVRDENEFYRIIGYILHNPVKANLVENWLDWKYSWVEKELKENMIIE
jgi:putative transposase